MSLTYPRHAEIVLFQKSDIHFSWTNVGLLRRKLDGANPGAIREYPQAAHKILRGREIDGTHAG
jgi:hypothetical protein